MRPGPTGTTCFHALTLLRFFAATPCLGGCLSHGAVYLLCLLNKPVVATHGQSDRQRRVGGHRNSMNVKAASGLSSTAEKTQQSHGVPVFMVWSYGLRER